MNFMTVLITSIVSISMSLFATISFAQEDFYSDKQIELIIPASSGSYHTYALLLAEYLPDYIPGKPAIIPVAMGGAGGIKASNFFANVGRTDGTTLYLMHQTAPNVQVLTPSRVKYDVGAMNPIGIVSSLNSVMAVRKDSGISTVSDATDKEVVLGTTGVGSYQYVVPTLLNNLEDTKFKLITTYTGTRETMLALERDEIAGLMTSLLTMQKNHPEWIEGDDLAHVILQVGEKRDPSLPDVPLLTDLADDESQSAIYNFMSLSNGFARSLVAPSGVPAERVEILRTAFDQLMNDPEFVAEARKRKIPLYWADATVLENAINSVLTASPEVISTAQSLLPQ